jgi:integrase
LCPKVSPIMPSDDADEPSDRYLFKRPGSDKWQARVRVPPGAGMGNKTHLQKTLGTSSLTEARKRLPHIVAELKAEIERARRTPEGHLKTARKPDVEEAEWYRRMVLQATGGDPTVPIPDDLSDRIAERAYELVGDPVDVDHDHRGRPVYVYDSEREAEADRFFVKATGKHVPVAGELDRYLTENRIKQRYEYRTRRAVNALGEWLKDRPRGDNMLTVSRREAGHFYDHLVAGGRTTRTVNSLVSALSAYWRWYAKRVQEIENPWTDQSRAVPEEEAELKRAYTDDEVTKLLSGRTTQTMHDMMRIGALTGMRIEEIGRLTVADCADDVFDIRKAKTRWGVRKVPIHPDLKPIIERRTKGKGPGEFLIEELKAPAGRPDERCAKATERFTLYRRSVGVDDRAEGQRQSNIDFHSFRRWFCNTAERAGQPPHIIEAVVGHKRAGMTLGKYSKEGPSIAQRRTCVESVKLPKDAPAEASADKVKPPGRWPGEEAA